MRNVRFVFPGELHIVLGMATGTRCVGGGGCRVNRENGGGNECRLNAGAVVPAAICGGALSLRWLQLHLQKLCPPSVGIAGQRACYGCRTLCNLCG